MHWVKNEAWDLHFEDDWAWVYSNSKSNSTLYQSVDGWLLHQMKSIQLQREEESRGEEYLISANIAVADVNTLFDDWLVPDWNLIELFLAPVDSPPSQA